MKQKNGVWRKILLPSIKHTDKQLNKMTKKGLIRLVKKLEKILIKIAYQQYKSKLPRLRTTKRKALPRRKTKKKAGIYTAKNGRKYKILASGKARFVKG